MTAARLFESGFHQISPPFENEAILSPAIPNFPTHVKRYNNSFQIMQQFNKMRKKCTGSWLTAITSRFNRISALLLISRMSVVTMSGELKRAQKLNSVWLCKCVIVIAPVWEDITKKNRNTKKFQLIWMIILTWKSCGNVPWENPRRSNLQDPHILKDPQKLQRLLEYSSQVLCLQANKKTACDLLSEFKKFTIHSCSQNIQKNEIQTTRHMLAVWRPHSQGFCCPHSQTE